MKIREKMFRILFPDYYKDYNNLIYLETLKNYKAFQSKKHEDNYKKVFEAIERDKVEVVAIKKNKNEEWVIVTKWIFQNNLWIKLYSPTYLAINQHPRIMSSLESLESDCFTEQKYAKIQDVLMEDNNVGNGTICMKYFIQEAKKIGCDFIKGCLSPVDKDHFDRSIHYYEKFGFSVKLSDDKNSGSIMLYLNEKTKTIG